MKTIDKNVVMLGWVSFFTDMASAMINPILPIFVVVVLHEGMDKLGIIVAIATFVSYALRLLSGYLSDRYGIVKPLVVGGYLLSALSKPLIGMTHGYQSIALTMDIAGELSGILILFGLLWYFGQSEAVIRSIFYATLIPGIIGVVIVTFFVEDIPKPKSLSRQAFVLTDRDKKAIVSLLFYFVFLFFVFSDAFFTMQAKEMGISIAVIPLLFAVSAAVQTLTSYGFGLMTDRFGVRYVLWFAYGCGVIAQGLLYLREPFFTWIAYAFLGLFTVASLNANRAFVSENADNRGSVYGVFYAGVALFGAAGAYVSGVIWEYFGMQSALLFSLVGTALLTLLYTGRGYARS